MPRTNSPRQTSTRLARLARCADAGRNLARSATSSRTFLAYAEQVQQLDTSGVAPTSHAIGAPTELRHDQRDAVSVRVTTWLYRRRRKPAREAGLFKRTHE